MTHKLPITNVFSESDLWDRDKAEDMVIQVVKQVPETLEGQFDEHIINFILANDEFVRAYNKVYRNMDEPTNVLAFPYKDDDYGPKDEQVILGDVYLAFETITREAQEQDKPFWDHFTHLAIHGFLHLLGYDHQTDEEAETMESLEIRVLKALNIPDPYHEESY